MGQRVREPGRLAGLAAADPRDDGLGAVLEGRDGGGDGGLLLQRSRVAVGRASDGAGVGDDRAAVRLVGVGRRAGDGLGGHGRARHAPWGCNWVRQLVVFLQRDIPLAGLGGLAVRKIYTRRSRRRRRTPGAQGGREGREEDEEEEEEEEEERDATTSAGEAPQAHGRWTGQRRRHEGWKNNHPGPLWILLLILLVCRLCRIRRPAAALRGGSTGEVLKPLMLVRSSDALPARLRSSSAFLRSPPASEGGRSQARTSDRANWCFSFSSFVFCPISVELSRFVREGFLFSRADVEKTSELSVYYIIFFFFFFFFFFFWMDAETCYEHCTKTPTLHLDGRACETYTLHLPPALIQRRPHRYQEKKQETNMVQRT
ncbi:hypothetical protein VTN02DRAFT_3342 [Thermoascus thermophilus]